MRREVVNALRTVDVVCRFLTREPSSWGTLRSDGKRLWSYDVVIGRWVGGVVHLPDACVFYSQTTSRHRGLLRRMAGFKGIPLKEMSSTPVDSPPQKGRRDGKEVKYDSTNS